MKIAMCASEVVPFAKTGGLADVAGALPLALERLKQEVIILMPFYGKAALVEADAEPVYPGVAATRLGRGIRVYFIKNDKYFNRSGLYGTQAGDFPDNLNRFSFFSGKCLELLKRIDFRPDIIHVHDWQASCVPLYLKAKFGPDPFYKNCRTLLTIHNLAYQGLFAREQFPKLGLDWSLFSIDGLEFYGKINLLKGGIIFSDCINTVSPTYASQIQTGDFGCGLEGVLAKRQDRLFGILNGLDYSIWDPSIDKFIAQTYRAGSLRDKQKNKRDLQKIAKLQASKECPLLGMVSRLAEQKGLDILAAALEQICKLNVQLVILGTGDMKYHKLLQKISRKFPKFLRLYLKFDNSLAHKIYAGSDMFLMPSKYEPCGLGQMISLKYATIPIVYKTGGLADTINQSNGFVFDNYSPAALVAVIKQAISAYLNQKDWQALMKRAMGYDFSWQESARQYLQLYKKIAGQQ